MTDNMKSPRGRPPRTVPRDDWHVAIERDLSVFWRLQGQDSFTGSTKKNFLSDLVNRLLREEMQRAIAQHSKEPK